MKQECKEKRRGKGGGGVQRERKKRKGSVEEGRRGDGREERAYV